MVLRAGSVAALGALALVAYPALGAEPPAVNHEAQSIFQEARKLDETGELARACALYEQALVLEPNAVGGRLHLARCYERIDKLASAASQYEVAERVATKGGQPERALYARRQLQALTPRLGTLTVDVPRAVRETSPDVLVSNDGSPLPREQWGADVPVDAGPHSVEASASGRSTWSMMAVVKNGQPSRIEVPVLRREASAVWPWVTGGLGLALGAAGAVFAVDQAKTQALVHQHCDARACDREGGFDAATANARLDRDFALALGLGIGGGLAVGASVIGLATASGSSPRASYTPWLGPRTAGLSATWVFE